MIKIIVYIYICIYVWLCVCVYAGLGVFDGFYDFVVDNQIHSAIGEESIKNMDINYIENMIINLLLLKSNASKLQCRGTYIKTWGIS